MLLRTLKAPIDYFFIFPENGRKMGSEPQTLWTSAQMNKVLEKKKFENCIIILNLKTNNKSLYSKKNSEQR